jgi:lipid II:glycine glycyltransferase (peptidoglycan interpeptide bridge formation enzyme)
LCSTWKRISAKYPAPKGFVVRLFSCLRTNRAIYRVHRPIYVIEDLAEPQKIFDGFSQNCRNRIKKAETNNVFVENTDDVELFLTLNSKTFARQDMKLPYSKGLVTKINNECAKRNARNIFIAKDAQNRIHTALFVVYDQKSMYALMSGNDPKIKDSWSGPLTRWKAIQFAGSVTPKYDFCGSMMPNVEPFFRSFGGTQMPYFRIFKDNRLLLLRMSDELRTSLGKTLLKFPRLGVPIRRIEG